MNNIKLTIAYDGTRYHGFQYQTRDLTVQQVLERALSKVYHTRIRVYAASRTDAGVHARGQVVNYFINNQIPIGKLPEALNTNLPTDVSVMDAEEVYPEFNARKDAVKKEYQFQLFHAPHMDPFWRNYAVHIRRLNLDYQAMERACHHFVGKHDYSAFQAIQGANLNIDPVKRILAVNMLMDGNLITFQVIGTGFLYKMVRIMVGTLLEVGKGKLLANDIPAIIQSKDRKETGPTAKPHGLVLERIWHKHDLA